jgi:hypothetical protein
MVFKSTGNRYALRSCDAFGRSYHFWRNGRLINGVDQTNPLDASNTNTGTSTSPSVSVTTVANNAWILDCFSGGSGTATSYTTSQTDRNAITLGSGFFTEQSSLGPVTPAGATSMAGTLGGSSPIWSHVAASFKPSTTAATRPRTLTMLGVG